MTSTVPMNPLGKTGLQVSRLGLGLAALGRPGYINIGHGEDLAYDYVVDAMERRTHRLLDLAYERGICYFDAARSYGRAEIFLKSWLNKRRPERVIVGSKWGYTYTANWQVEAKQHEVKEHSLQVLNRQWEKSSILLPHLQLYQIHSATFDSGVLTNEAVLDYLQELKDQYGIRIGLTLSGSRQKELLQFARETAPNGHPLFDTVQITYNLMEQSVEDALKEAADHGMGIIIKEALANGRLTERNANPEFAPAKEILQAIAHRHGVGIDAIALAFVLSRPWAHIVLSGAAVANHLQSNLQATGVQLSGEERSELEGLRVAPENYWEERQALKWN